MAATLDLLLVVVAVVGAAGYLVWSLGLRSKKPACHPVIDEGPSANVVVGGALQKGLDRARTRSKSRPVESGSRPSRTARGQGGLEEA